MHGSFEEGQHVLSIRPVVIEVIDIPARRYQAVVSRDNLVAAQPNLHNGSLYLRPHLDEPLHDGFGIVIITVAIHGNADILLRATRETMLHTLIPSLTQCALGLNRRLTLSQHGIRPHGATMFSN